MCLIRDVRNVSKHHSTFKLALKQQTRSCMNMVHGLMFDWSFTVVCISFSANKPLSVTAGNRLRNISNIFWQTQFSSRVGNAVLPTTVGKSTYHFLCTPLINKSSFMKQVLWNQHEGCSLIVCLRQKTEQVYQRKVLTNQRFTTIKVLKIVSSS